MRRDEYETRRAKPPSWLKEDVKLFFDDNIGKEHFHKALENMYINDIAVVSRKQLQDLLLVKDNKKFSKKSRELLEYLLKDESDRYR